jgi:outer membrane receptor for ferrienterochelin and colicins
MAPFASSRTSPNRSAVGVHYQNSSEGKTMVRLSRHYIVTVCAAALALLPWLGDAEEPTRGDTDRANLLDLPIEELMNVDVVLAASRYEQPTARAPASVTIITADEIRWYGWRTLADILRSVRSFYVTSDRNYSYLGVRGFLRPGDYNERVLLMIDGHAINENLFGSTAIEAGFSIDVDLIERVEIIRGPSSSLYGTNAFFGVINVITKRAEQFSGAELSAAAASFNTNSGRFTYGTQLQSGLEVLLSGSILDSDGQTLFFKEFDDPSTNNGYTDNDDEQAHSLFASLAYREFVLQASYVRREKGIPTAPWGIVFDDPRNRTVDTVGYLDLKWEHTFPSRAVLMARTSYNRYDYDGGYVYDWAESGNPPDLILDTDLGRGEWWDTELQFTTPIGRRHKLTLGGELQDNLRQDQTNFDQIGPEKAFNLDDKRDSVSWGLYAQDEFALLDNLILNAGVRYDHYETFGSTTNPRAALIYAPWKDTTVKLLYGEAFRAPNVYELYFDDGGVAQKGNPDLQPEIITTYELVLEQALRKDLRLTISGFYFRLDDLITLTIDPDDGLLVYENIGSVDSKGIEIELERRWQTGWRTRISYSYQDTRDRETDLRLTNSPEHLAKLNLMAPLADEKLLAGLELQYVSDRTTPFDTTADGYIVTNLTLLAGRFSNGWEISAGIHNLFDTRYGDPGSEEHAQDVIEQNGRSFQIKVTYRF